jgi:hypothetical protein
MATIAEQFPHYHKSVKKLDSIDVYRVLSLFDVTDPCLQHAIKKLLVAGGRGGKDISKDVAEAIVTLTRWQEIQVENMPTPVVVEEGKPFTMLTPEQGAAEVTAEMLRQQREQQAGIRVVPA